MKNSAKPGKTKKNKAVISPWREFEFWFMIIQKAIVPRVSIEQVIENWAEIKSNLMENSRHRELQIQKLDYFI